jgi:hypothetical protein
LGKNDPFSRAGTFNLVNTTWKPQHLLNHHDLHLNPMSVDTFKPDQIPAFQIRSGFNPVIRSQSGVSPEIPVMHILPP